MTYKEAYRISKGWRRKAAIISLFHHKMKMKNKRKWSVRKTGAYFDIAIGKVSEDIQLVLNMELVEKCDTRQHALILLKSQVRTGK